MLLCESFPLRRYYKNEEAFESESSFELLIFGLENEADTFAQKSDYDDNNVTWRSFVPLLQSQKSSFLMNSMQDEPQENTELTQLIRRIQKNLILRIMLDRARYEFGHGSNGTDLCIEYGRLIAHGTPDEIKTNKRVIGSSI